MMRNVKPLIGHIAITANSHWLTLNNPNPSSGSLRVFLIMFDRCDELLGLGYYLARGLSYLVTSSPHSEQSSQLSVEKLMNTAKVSSSWNNWSRS